MIGVASLMEASDNDETICSRRSPPVVTFKLDPLPKSKQKSKTSSLGKLHSAKGLLLLIVVIKIALYLCIWICELSFVLKMKKLDTVRFPTFYPEDWKLFRPQLIKHLLVTQVFQLAWDVFIFVAILKNWLFIAWTWFNGKVLPERSSRIFQFSKSVLFVVILMSCWVGSKYIEGGILTLIYRGFDYKLPVLPHLIHKSWKIILGISMVGVCGGLASWEWLGDARHFSLIAAALIFVIHFVILFLEPTQLGLKLKYGSQIYKIDIESEMYALLAGVSRICDNYPLENFWFLKKKFGRTVRSCGYRTFSAVIIDNGLIGQMEEMAPLIADAFKETSGFDDADQMFLGAVAHDIGHAMMGQVLWYHALGFGLIYAAFAWITFSWVLQKPILFRPFGFRHKPAPAVCAILIFGVGVWYGWEVLGRPLSNLISWLIEYEADMYAVSVGFGPSLQKYLYGSQAAGLSLRRSFSLPMALYRDDHPPYMTRIKWLQS